MTVPREILILSPEIEVRRILVHILKNQDLEPICCSTLREATEILQKETVGLIFCDKNFPDGTYRDILIFTRSLKSRVRIVVTSPQADWDEYLEAMRLGAFDAIASPCRPTDVEWMVIQAKRDERNKSRQPVPAESVSSKYHQAVAGNAS